MLAATYTNEKNSVTTVRDFSNFIWQIASNYDDTFRIVCNAKQIIILQPFLMIVYGQMCFVSVCIMWPAIPIMTTMAKLYHILQTHEHATITQYTFLPTAECVKANV